MLLYDSNLAKNIFNFIVSKVFFFFIFNILFLYFKYLAFRDCYNHISVVPYYWNFYVMFMYQQSFLPYINERSFP